MSYPGQGPADYRLGGTGLWTRTAYIMPFGCPSLNGLLAGIIRFGQQSAGAVGVSEALSALVPGPFTIADFVVRNRTAPQTVDVDWAVYVDNVITAAAVSVAAGVTEESVSVSESFGSGLHLVRVQFAAAGADATASAPAASVRILQG